MTPERLAEQLQKAGQALVMLFGDWRDKTRNVKPSPVGRKVMQFLNGQGHVRVTKPIADGVRDQFAVVHRYREVLDAHLKSLCARLVKEAQEGVPVLDKPTGPAEAYAIGVAMGRYLALMRLGQCFQDGMNAAFNEATKITAKPETKPEPDK